MHIALWLLLSLLVASVDEGSGIDPNGGALTTGGDHRCTIDPNGNDCIGTFGGGGMDPNG